MKVRNEMKQNATIFITIKKRRTRAIENINRKKTNFKKILKNKFKTKKHNAMKNIIFKLSIHIRVKLRKTNKCFKCETTKHMSIDSNASCQKKITSHEKKSNFFFQK